MGKAGRDGWKNQLIKFQMEEHISINRNQVLGRILGATVFVALGIWLFFFTPATENLWIKNPLLYRLSYSDLMFILL